MYLALTYDHRLLDGREAVTFLVKVNHSFWTFFMDCVLTLAKRRSRNTLKTPVGCCWGRSFTLHAD